MKAQAGGAGRLARIALPALGVSLLLGALMLVATGQPASGQQVIDQVCVTGVFADDACLVRSDEVPACDPDTCAIQATRPTACLEAFECPIVEPAQQGAEMCPDGVLGSVEDICFIYVAAGPGRCIRAVLSDDGNCVRQVGATARSYFCEDGTAPVGRSCTSYEDPTYGFCPSSSEPVNGACIDFAIDGLVAGCGLLNEDFESLRCVEPADLLPLSALSCGPGIEFIEDQCMVPSSTTTAQLCSYIDESDESDEWIESEDGRCRSVAQPVEARCPQGYSRDTKANLDPDWNPGGCFRFEFTELPCIEGLPTPDGQKCYLNAVHMPPTWVCPEGFLPDSSLNGICARFERAEQGEPRCPEGASEDDNGCYILVAFGPQGEPTCAEGTLAGSLCVIEGDPPQPTAGTCAVSDTVFLDGDFCYTLADRDFAGQCPPDSVEVNGECRVEEPIRPGPPTCADTTFSLVDGRCIRYVAPDFDPSCPEGAEEISLPDNSTECRQPVAYQDGLYFCPDPTAALNGRSCVFTAARILVETYTCRDRGELTVDDQFDVPICVLGDVLVPDCGDGRYDGSVCMFLAPFEVLTCALGFSPIQGWPVCEGFLPQQVEYSCLGEDVLTVQADTAQCWTQQGPQPGGCAGVTRDDQCYGFVPHRLSCAPGGCLVSVPAAPSAPIAERGDVDCDGQLILLDAFLLARSIADTDLGRETTCAGVSANGGIRVTAADVANDGTISNNDARRLLQCIVDGNLSNCAG